MRASPLAALLVFASVAAPAADWDPQAGGVRFQKDADRPVAAPRTSNGGSSCEGAPAPHVYKKKKGFGLASRDGGQDTDAILQALKAGWHYNWAVQRREQSDIEFVPMVYDTNPQYKDLNVGELRKGHEAVLGFNEPEFNHVSVEGGQKAWPWIEQAAGHARLGSAAEGMGNAGSDPDNSWLVHFAAGTPGRVDFVAVHYYRDDNEANFEKFLTETYHRFCLPIWVTEYGLGDWYAGLANPADAAEEKRYGEKIIPICTKDQLALIDEHKHPNCVDLRHAEANAEKDAEKYHHPKAAVGGSNKFTIERAAEFMRESMTFMDHTPWIERYSWWSPASGNVPPQTSTNLLWYRDESGQIRLTKLGEVYAGQ